MGVVALQQFVADDPFADFWCLYPRHVAKLAARKAWAKVDASNHVLIFVALVDWRPVWRDKDEEFIPHAATWLRGERWTDSLPQAYRRSAMPLAAPVGVDQPKPVREPIPAYVLAVMAKLRGHA